MARAPRICGQVGCPNLVTTAGRCDDHQREAWASSDRREHLPGNWNTIRKRILKRDAWRCQLRYPGVCTLTASEVDHIGSRDSHVPGNLRSVCHECHQVRTNADAKTAQAAVRGRGKRPPEPHPGIV